MSAKSTDVMTKSAGVAEYTSRFSVVDLLPGENQADREQLRVAHFGELAPSTPYECAIAEQLVEYEWEILRHRHLRNACYLASYREIAANVIQLGDPMKFGIRDTLSDDDVLLLRDLVGDDPNDRTTAEIDFLNKTGWDPRHILAIAVGRSKPADAHEAKIADLERRRRILRKDYAELKAIRKAVVEDAEFVEGST